MSYATIDTVLKDVPIQVKVFVHDDGVVDIEKILIINDSAGPIPKPIELPYGMLNDKDVEAINESAIDNIKDKHSDEEEANAKASGDTCTGGLVSILALIGMHLANGGSGHV
jgi:hypothetical protein